MFIQGVYQYYRRMSLHSTTFSYEKLNAIWEVLSSFARSSQGSNYEYIFLFYIHQLSDKFRTFQSPSLNQL